MADPVNLDDGNAQLVLEANAVVILSSTWRLTHPGDFDCTALLFTSTGEFADAATPTHPNCADGALEHFGDDVKHINERAMVMKRQNRKRRTSVTSREKICIRLGDLPHHMCAIVLDFSNFGEGGLRTATNMQVNVEDKDGMVLARRQIAIAEVLSADKANKHSSMPLVRFVRIEDDGAMPNKPNQWLVEGIHGVSGPGQTLHEAVPVAQLALANRLEGCAERAEKAMAVIHGEPLPPTVEVVEDVLRLLTDKVMSALYDMRSLRRGTSHKYDAVQRAFADSAARVILSEHTSLFGVHVNRSSRVRRLVRVLRLLERAFEMLQVGGKLCWDSLTSFVVLAHASASAGTVAKGSSRFVHDRSFPNTVPRGSAVRTFCPMVGSRFGCAFATIFECSDTINLCKRDGSIYETICPSSNRNTAVLDLTFWCSTTENPNAQQWHAENLAVSTADGAVVLWHCEHNPVENRKHDRAEQPAWKLQATMDAGEPMSLLRWCATGRLVDDKAGGFLVSAAGSAICVWDLHACQIVVRIQKHTAKITDLLEIPGECMLASASLDKRIHMWDTRKVLGHEPVTSLVGHSCGVKQLASCGTVLVSAGFEFEPHVWDINSGQKPMLLRGHTAALVGVQVMRTADFHSFLAITMDADELIKVWQIDMHLLQAPCCLQTVEMAEGLLSTPRTLLAMPPSYHPEKRDRASSPTVDVPCFVVGGTRAVAFTARSKRVRQRSATGSCALLSTRDGTIMSASGTDLRVWAAHSGRLVRTAASKKQFTVMTLDNQHQRRLLSGDADGYIASLSFATGWQFDKLKVHSHGVRAIMESGQPGQFVTTSHVTAELCVVQHNFQRDKLVLLRQVTDAMHPDHDEPFDHEIAITALTVSPPHLALIATGGENGTLRTWSFESLLLRDCLMGHTAEVTALAFLGDYILLSADATGAILLWSVQSRQQRFLGRLNTATAFPDGVPSAVRSIAVLQASSHALSTHVVATGHDSGHMCVWKLADVIDAVLPGSNRHLRRSSLAQTTNQRRMYACCKSHISTATQVMAPREEKRCTSLPFDSSWLAHDGGVVTVSLLECNTTVPVLVSVGFDDMIRFWNTQGHLLGYLQTNGVITASPTSAIDARLHEGEWRVHIKDLQPGTTPTSASAAQKKDLCASKGNGFIQVSSQLIAEARKAQKRIEGRTMKADGEIDHEQRARALLQTMHEEQQLDIMGDGASKQLHNSSTASLDEVAAKSDDASSDDSEDIRFFRRASLRTQLAKRGNKSEGDVQGEVSEHAEVPESSKLDRRQMTSAREDLTTSQACKNVLGRVMYPNLYGIGHPKRRTQKASSDEFGRPVTSQFLREQLASRIERREKNQKTAAQRHARLARLKQLKSSRDTGQAGGSFFLTSDVDVSRQSGGGRSRRRKQHADKLDLDANTSSKQSAHEWDSAQARLEQAMLSAEETRLPDILESPGKRGQDGSGCDCLIPSPDRSPGVEESATWTRMKGTVARFLDAAALDDTDDTHTTSERKAMHKHKIQQAADESLRRCVSRMERRHVHTVADEPHKL